MNRKIKYRPVTLDEAIKVAYSSPNHIYKVETSLGQVEVRIATFVKPGRTSVTNAPQGKMKKKWVEGKDYEIVGGTNEHPADAFSRTLKKFKAKNIPEGEETDLSVNKNKYLYGTTEKEGIIK